MAKSRKAEVTYKFDVSSSGDPFILFHAALEFDDATSSRDSDGMQIHGLAEAEALLAELDKRIREVKRMERARKGIR